MIYILADAFRNSSAKQDMIVTVLMKLNIAGIMFELFLDPLQHWNNLSNQPSRTWGAESQYFKAR